MEGMPMKNNLENEKPLVCSYLTLRKTIGVLGIAFPFVLSLGAVIIFQTGLRSSLSAYYHTGMRDVYAATLCVIGFFLFSYKGYTRVDDIAGDLGCIFAVGAALFPTPPAGATSSGARLIGYAHVAFSALFFLTLTYFALFLFTKTNPNKSPSKRKLQRNKVYRICGYTMLISILLIALYFFLPNTLTSPFRALNPIYWLEALTALAFGISWFTKGKAILKDEVQL
jgi:hypothetical protein